MTTPQDGSERGAPVGPLAGVHVLEVGQLVSGPYAGSILADLGATVTKVEAPESGDPLRGMQVAGSPWFWLVEGRNKACITLNLRVSEGQALFLRLVKTTDILIENFRPGTLDGWNLDEDKLRSVNEDLIIVRISGFGQSGPYRDRPSTDRQALAFSGVAYVTGHPNSPPVKPGVAVSDFVAGLHGAIGALAALHHQRLDGGQGQSVDVSLYEGMFRMTADLLAEYQTTGQLRERSGNRNPAVPGGAYLCADGIWLMIAASTDRLWRNLTSAMGRPDLAEDDRLTGNVGRQLHADEVEQGVVAWVANHDAATVESILISYHIPASRLYTAPDILSDEHYRARQSFVEVDTPYGKVNMPSVVARFSKTPGAVRHAGRKKGADNRSIYCSELDISEDELIGLRERGVI